MEKEKFWRNRTLNPMKAQRWRVTSSPRQAHPQIKGPLTFGCFNRRRAVIGRGFDVSYPDSELQESIRPSSLQDITSHLMLINTGNLRAAAHFIYTRFPCLKTNFNTLFCHCFSIRWHSQYQHTQVLVYYERVFRVSATGVMLLLSLCACWWNQDKQRWTSGAMAEQGYQTDDVLVQCGGIFVLFY